MRMRGKQREGGRGFGGAALLASTIVTTGCPSPDPPKDGPLEAGGGTTPAIYVDTVLHRPAVLRGDVDLRILSDDLAGQVVLEPDALLFPDTGEELVRGLRPGAIVASGAGVGFLRRVVCVEGDSDCPTSHAIAAPGEFRVLTSIATLGDVFKDASWTWTITADPLSGPLDPIVADLPNANVTLQATWGISPTFVVQVDIKDGAVTAVAAAATADLSLDWQASLLVDAGFSWAREERLPDLPVFPPYLVQIGPLPVTISLDLTTTASVGFDVTARAKTTLTGRCTTQVGGGLRYEAATQTWTLAGDSTALDCPIATPTLDEVEVSADASLSLRPDLRLLVYGMVGVEAGLDGTIDAKLRLCPPPSSWKVELTRGYHMGLVAPLLGIEKDLYAEYMTTRLAGGDVPTPEVCDYLEWAQWPIPADAPNTSVYAITADIVTDTVTNLVWQRSTASSFLAWQGAKTYCGSLSIGDTTGWRLPTAIELQSILHYNGFSLYYFPAGLNHTVFSGPDTTYWSSSSVASGANAAWTVNFERIGNGGMIAADDVTASHAVRCVWSAPLGPVPLSRYTTESGGIRDLQTGLIWQAIPSATTFSSLTDAQMYCADQGMRVPTIKELRSLVKIRAFNPAVDSNWFPDTPPNRFWANTSLRFRTGGGDYLYTWSSDFIDGDAAIGPQSGAAAFVRCVK